MFIKKICKILNIECKHDKMTNQKDGTYDMKINNKRVEIKTACVGKSGSLQHETLRNNCCDFFMFISIFPEYFYITILPSFDLNKKNDIMKLKPHLRKGTTNVYKYTFNERHILIDIKMNKSIKISKDTNILELSKFMNMIFV